MRPTLVPGAHVLRRDADTLQVGLDPTTRVLLADTPRHRRLLLEPPTGSTRVTLDPVLLPDDAALRAALPPAGSADADALWARHTIAARALRGRAGESDGRLVPAGAIVMVQAYGGPLAQRIADDVRTLLRRGALPAPVQRRPGPRAEGAPGEVHVVVGVGEPPRDALDERTERAVPHLLLRFVEGRAVVGPFVSPGSACLRCLDLHRTETDPAWPLLREQYSRLTRHDRADGVPEPVDAALAAVANGWVVRDIAAHLFGRIPVTRSRTLTLSSDLVEVVLQDWPQRPDCGCATH